MIVDKLSYGCYIVVILDLWLPLKGYYIVRKNNKLFEWYKKCSKNNATNT